MNLAQALRSGKWFRMRGHSVAYRYSQDKLHFKIDNDPDGQGVCEDPVFMTHEIVSERWIRDPGYAEQVNAGVTDAGPGPDVDVLGEPERLESAGAETEG